MSEKDKTILIPSFSGKDEDFQVWWTKFRAFGTAKGFIKVLIGKEPDLPDKEDQNLDEQMKQIRRK